MSVPRAVFDQTLTSLLAPIARFLEGDEGSEIMINGHDEIYVEKRQFSLAERTLRESVDILEDSLPSSDVELLAARSSYETARRNLDSVPASQQ